MPVNRCIIQELMLADPLEACTAPHVPLAMVGVRLVAEPSMSTVASPSRNAPIPTKRV